MNLDEFYKKAVEGTHAGDVISESSLEKTVKKIALEYAKYVVRNYEHDTLYYGRNNYYSDVDIAESYIKEKLSSY